MMTNYEAFFVLNARIPVLSTADNGPGNKLVRLDDGREIVAESFEAAIAMLIDTS